MSGAEGDIANWQFGFIAMAAGIVLIAGALRRWKWLVDPPEEFKWFYTQSLLKAVYGSEWCRGITLSFGFLLVSLGAIIIGIVFF
jgi:hypothetical protein